MFNYRCDILRLGDSWCYYHTRSEHMTDTYFIISILRYYFIKVALRINK